GLLQPPQCCLQLLLGVLAIGDVALGRGHAAGTSAVVRELGERQPYVEDPAVLGKALYLQRLPPLAAGDGREAAAEPSALLRPPGRVRRSSGAGPRPPSSRTSAPRRGSSRG